MSDSKHLDWQADALWQRLEPLLPGLSVEVLARTESTNSVLLERARRAGGRRSDDSQPCLLVAEQQTRGRGRHGRHWLSHVGSSLTFSLSLALKPPHWQGLSLAVGLALADALDPAQPGQPPRLGLKWPNDLWLWDGPGRGRKLGGILIETVQVASQRMAVIGIGLNLEPQALEGLSQGYACLAEMGQESRAPQVLACVAVPLAKAVQAFEADGLPPLLDGYARRDLLAGQPVDAEGASALSGVAEGIDAEGALLLRDRQGVVHAVASGEVSARLRGDGAC